jgi:hypothetical protein
MVSEILKKPSAPEAAIPNQRLASANSGEFSRKASPEPKPHWNQWFPVPPGA